MSENTIPKTISNMTDVINQKNTSEESQQTFTSNLKFERKSSIKKVQLEVKINISLMLNDIKPTFPYSQSISFRLKPITPSLSKETENQNIKSEIYYNSTLEQKLSQFKPILHVDLSYCNLIDSDISIIVNQIILEKKCTELWLYGNKITSQGIIILALSLVNNSTLKSLDLSFNQISDLGVHSLTQALLPNNNSSLKILYLSKNGISNDGAKYLSEMLKINQTLRELWLSNNEIGNKGIKQLANILAYHNKTLKCLSLSMNIFITDLCIDYLIEMFEHNQTLKTLWINGCNLTEQGKIKLHEKANQKKNFNIEL